MANQANESQTVQINTGDDLSRGRFSNTMLVAHGPEEFIIDWILNSPNGAHLVSRIIVTPGHVKRIIRALEENLEKYEESFGEVSLTDPPPPMIN